MAERVGAGRGTGWTVVNILVVVYALFPVLWILSLSLKPTSTVKDGKLIPSQITFDNYKGIFSGDIFTSALINSIGIGLITTVIAVVVGGMAAYAVARLSFPGKRLLVGVALLIAMFPQISLVTPIFNLWRSIGLFDTWPGLISTRSMWIPQPNAGLSIINSRPWLRPSRLDSRSSRLLLPMIERSEVWATCPTADM
jgi:multiple sugar transport system permease protein